MDTVYCVVKMVDGVPAVCMIHATREGAESSCKDMNGWTRDGYFVEARYLHN